MESVNALSMEVKKLSKKNAKLSSIVELQKRRPPVCNVCLEMMLHDKGDGLVKAGVAAATGTDLGGSKAAADSIMPPGKASRVPFNLEATMHQSEAVQPMSAAGSRRPVDFQGAVAAHQQPLSHPHQQTRDTDVSIDHHVFRSGAASASPSPPAGLGGSVRFRRRDVML